MEEIIGRAWECNKIVGDCMPSSVMETLEYNVHMPILGCAFGQTQLCSIG